jgi:hypothetical protein
MILILLSWLYILCVSYFIGVGFHSLVQKLTNTSQPILSHFSIICISGLLLTSFFSTVISLLIPLSITSAVIVLCISLLSVIVFRKSFVASINYNFSLLKNTPLPAILLCAAFMFVVTRLSYIPSSHNDDGLYYSTSIRWLQEYGTVKGLANINPRIAFNSTWLILQAQYSFHFLQLGLFNDLNGFLLVCLLIYDCGGITRLIRGNTDLSTIVRAFFILPALLFHHTATSDLFLFNVNFISSPTADIPATLLLWLIVVLSLENSNGALSTSGKMMNATDALLIVYIISAITIKLIAIPMLLLIVYYCYKLIFAKQWKPLVVLTASCIVLVIPWLIRNVLLSGYLVFPFSSVDLFTVDWKLPIENVYWHENAVKAFVVDSYTTPGSNNWISNWLLEQSYINTVLLIIIACSMAAYVAIALYHLAKQNRSFFKQNSNLIITIMTLVSGIIFWFIKGPDFRFGYGFIIIFCILSLSLFMRYFLLNNVKYTGWLIIFMCTSSLYFVYKNDFKAGKTEFTKPMLPLRQPQQIKQQSMSNGQPFYLVNGADIWNAPLPAATEEEYIYIMPALRTKHLKDGFKALNKQHE